MRSTLINLALLLPLSFLSCVRPPANHAPSGGIATPTVICVPDHVYIGEILQNEKRSCVFEVHNDTTESIQITRLYASCGCTSVKAESLNIPPKAVDHITATFTPGLRVGSFASIVTISWQSVTLGPKDIKVRLSANAVRLLTTDPPICHFGEKDVDHPSPINFVIYRGEAKLPWDNLKLSSTKFKVSCTKVDDNKFAVNLPLSADKFPLGVIQDDITASLLKSDKVVAQTIIPVELKLVSNIKVTPPALYNGVVNQHVSKHGLFSIESTASAGLHFISMASSDSNFIQARCIETQPGKLIFEYTTSANCSPGAHSGHLLVSVKTNKQRQVLVPFISYIQ